METKQKRTKVKVSVLALTVLVLLTLSGPAWAVEGMISYWKFDEASGTMAYDSVGVNDGTIYGAQWILGKLNGALSFDGVDDYVEVPDSSSLDITGDIRVEAWVYPRSWPGGSHWPGIVCKGPGSYLEAYSLYFQSDGRFSAIVNSDQTSSGRTAILDTVPSSTNEWHHLVMVLDGTTFSSYRNGQLVGSTTHTGGIKANDFVLHIGVMHNEPMSWYGTDYFDGLIDEVAIYDGALSASIEIEIDIKPGSYPSSINLRSKGVTPVAIHTTSIGDGESQDFDATNVDPETVELNGVAAVKWEIYDCDELENPDYIDPIETPDEPEMIGDGDLDLVVYFDTQELGAASPPDGLHVGDTEATLTGATFGGTLIEGMGDVNIVVKGEP